MSKNLSGEGDLTQAKEQDGADLLAEELEQVAGGRPVKPIRPRADADTMSFEQLRSDHRPTPRKY